MVFHTWIVPGETVDWRRRAFSGCDGLAWISQYRAEVTMALNGQTVLVTGSSGFLGSALTQRLVANGVKVRALVRSPRKAALLREAVGVGDIEIVQGDVLDAASLAAAAEGCTVVFHCAAALGGKLGVQRQVNVVGARNLMQAAADAGVRRVVHVSTLSVYGMLYDGVITEDMAHGPGSDAYGLTKSEAEGAVREVGAARGQEYTIIRPGMIFGARSHMWTEVVFRLARLKPTPWFGSGKGFAHCIYVDDVADMMIVLAEHPRAVGEAFNCTYDPAVTWRSYLGEYSRLARSVNDDFLELPPWMLYALAGVGMMFSPPYSPGKMLPDYVDFMQKRAQFSMAKARDLLDWEPQVSLEEGIGRCAEWLRQRGLLT
ncbi:MAG: SDR family NAD(P)-dependent oxidoreductase [Anaerolineae bacterium]|nr:SDR family NAD(P)-dependent oxidoreductase [Anaerolineae bacterium]